MDAAILPAATPADVNPTTPKAGIMASGATKAAPVPIIHAFVIVELSFHLVSIETAVFLTNFPNYFALSKNCECEVI
jgi:hypothetical protein